MTTPTPEERAKSVATHLGLSDYSNGMIPELYLDTIAAAIRKAVEEEREACASIVESAPMGSRAGAHHLFAELCELAAAIRARATPAKE